MREYCKLYRSVVGWDILGLDVRAHSKPKLVHFVLALQALHDFATTRELDVAAALRVARTSITEDDPVQILASDFILRV